MSIALRNIAGQLCQKWRPVYGQLAAVRSFAKAAASPESRDIQSNEPMQYFGSKAATWRAKQSREGNADDRLWYQSYVVTGSTAIFLLYFCVFREESDIDIKLEESLFEHVDGLEEQQLLVSYNYNKERGLSVQSIEERLTALGIDVKQLNTK